MGTYDSLKEPSIITEGWKYICYTNQNVKSDIWEIIPTRLQTTKEVRKIKIIPPLEYKLCIWIDASIEINCNLDEFVKKYHEGIFTIMKHPHRNCIYEEANACIARRKDNLLVINNQINTYRRSRYPSNNGMVATGLMIRENCDKVNRFCQKWWGEVERHSKRDQLSFNYVTHMLSMKFSLIPYDVLDKEFKLHPHNK